MDGEMKGTENTKNSVITIIRGAGPWVLFILLLAVVFLFFRWFLGQVRHLEPNVAAALIVGLVALFGYFYTQRQTKARELSEAHRKPKTEVYDAFFDVIDCFLHKEGSQEIDPNNLPKEVEELFAKLRRGLIVWGSVGAIKKWELFKGAAAGTGREAIILLAMDDMLREIRKDLGNSNRGLKRGDLVKVFLRDPKELDKLMAGSVPKAI
jgi:hypothetical protein